MQLTLIFALLQCATVWTLAAEDEKQEPMVAFLCNLPSMYLTNGGWIKDDNTSCLKDPVDILNYCHKVFPDLDVRNVVEANEKVTISNWCSFGQTKCQYQFTVRPFRCLVGPFQSDALLVPEHCVFDHVHDAKTCTSYAEWSKTATRSCTTRSLELQSFSMLQPCGIDKFNGVEFVCCPISKVRPSATVPAAVATEAPATHSDPLSAYKNRVVGHGGHKWNEHDYYLKALDDMHRHHQDKMAKVMKEWATARQHVVDLKGRDPKGAEKLNREITIRFQKTYEALEVEAALEKKQLTALHQQRVQSELNDKKRVALDAYMRAIDDNSDPSEILRTLKHYIKALQKDRLHTVNRYKHLRDTDPAEAEAQRVAMADHLRTVDRQLAVATGMLDRVPRYQKKIQVQIDDYLDAYHAIDARVAVLMRSLVDNPPSTTPTTTTTQKPFDPDDYVDDEDQDSDESDDGEDPVDEEEPEKPDETNQEEPDEENEEDTEDDVDEDEDEDEEDEVIVRQVVADGRMDYKKKEATEDGKDETYEDEDKDEDDDSDESDIPVATTPKAAATPAAPKPRHEGDVVEFLDEELAPGQPAHEPFVAHADKSYLSVKEPYIKKASTKGENNFNAAAVPIGVVVGTATVIAVILAGVVALRRRSQRRRSRMAVNVRLDPSASPEERHIAAMQMTGYENPTYKYFESSGVANA